MGNRAVITTRENFENNGVGVYLHWNGGRDSVEPFLEYCKIRGYRAPETDCYGWARLCQVIGNFFGGNTSIGIDTLDHLDCDNGDNGVYIIENWEIVGREYFGFVYDDGKEVVRAEQNYYDRVEMLQAIDEAQPQPIGKEFFEAEEVPTKDLKLGDTVYVQNWDGEYKKLTVKGFGDDRYCNGYNINGKPFVDACENGMLDNCNNYILKDTAIRVKA